MPAKKKLKKRVKKARKPVKRVRAASGGKSGSSFKGKTNTKPSSSSVSSSVRREGAGKDLGKVDELLNWLNRNALGFTQDEAVGIGQQLYPGIERVEQERFGDKGMHPIDPYSFSAQHLANAETAARKLREAGVPDFLATPILQYLGGRIEETEGLFSGTNDPDRPGELPSDTALDYLANKVGREVGQASNPREEAILRKQGVADINRLAERLREGSVDPFEVQRDLAPIFGNINQFRMPNLERVRPAGPTTGQTRSPGTAATVRGYHGGRARAAGGGASIRVPTTTFRSQGSNVPGQPATQQELNASPFKDFGANFESLGVGTFPSIYNKQEGRVNDINAPTGVLDNLVGQLSGFRAGGDGMINDLRNFNPFNVGGVQGAGALQQGIDTGFKTDVSGLTEAAKIRAGQEFDTAQDRIGERLASLGLTSSSARTSQVAGEKAKMAERIAAAGLEGEVGANESAAARRLQALGLLGQGAGLSLSGKQSGLQGRLSQEQMRLSGLQSAAQGAGTSSGQQLQASLGRAQSGQSLMNSLPQFGSVFGNKGEAGEAGPTGAPRSSVFQHRLGANFGTGGQYQRPSMPRQSPLAAGPLQARRPFARGGRTSPQDEFPPEFRSWLSMMGAELMRGQPGIKPHGFDRSAFADIALNKLGGPEEAFSLFSNKDKQGEFVQTGRDRLEGVAGVIKPHSIAQWMLLGQGLTPGGASGKQRFNIQGLGVSSKDRAALGIDPSAFIGSPEELEKLAMRANRPDANALRNQQFSVPDDGLGSLTGQNRTNALEAGRGSGIDILGRQGSRANRQFFCEGGPVRQMAAGGGVPQPELPNEMGIQVPGLNDPRRQFFNDGGGVAPGEDTGEDKIPALLRSEELVVTPELVQELENADPMVPQPQLIAALQQLAQRPLEFAEEAGEFVAQEGGVMDSRPGFTEWLSELLGGFIPGQQPTPFSPETHPELFGQAPLDMQPEEFPGQHSLSGVNPPSLAPSAPQLGGDGFPESPDIRQRAAEGFVRGELGIPSPAEIEAATREPSGAGEGFEVPNSFSVETDPVTGIRSFSLSGSPGVAGLEAGLGRPLRGNVTESPIIRGEDGTPLRDTFPEESRLERAQRRADMIRGVLNSDPIGGPQKQARLFNSLQAAEREVEAAINEIVASQTQAIAAANAKAQQTTAQAALNNSIAAGLNAQANKATADAQVAKQLLEASKTDPVVAQILNAFETAAKFKDTNPKMQAQLEAVIRRQLEARGLQLTEPGFLARLFGAPEFEVQPIRPETPEEAVDANIDAPGNDPLMNVLTPEQLAILQQFGV